MTYTTNTLTTPSGWSVTYTIKDADNATYSVRNVTINRVQYDLHGEIKSDWHYVGLRRCNDYKHYGTNAARRKADAELKPVIRAIQALMNQGNATRNAMIKEAQLAMKQIEDQMQELVKARAALSELAETLDGKHDKHLEIVSRAEPRHKIACYYNAREAINIPYWCDQIKKNIS